MEHTSQAWSVSDPTQLRWRSWDGQYVIYHCASGDTHLLQPVAAVVLRRVQASPTTLETLIRDVRTELGLESEPDLPDQIEDLLGRFEALGLVECVG